MRRTWLACMVVAAVAAGCGGSSKPSGHSSKPSGPDPRASQYAAAMRVFHNGDFDGARSRLIALGNYRDAKAKLAFVTQVAGQRKLTQARRKLARGHTAAALAMARTATGRYGNRSRKALAFLALAYRSQSFYHHCQQRHLAQHKSPAECTRLARVFAQTH